MNNNNLAKKARVIAFYLPQFYPIPENDEWWGKGFTEWTNVGKAKPLFKGHLQPRVPADLGYYDLRLNDVREAQADMAREAGVEGFMYWHYWFGDGRRILERTFEEVVNSGKPEFPFCLGWANHSWTNKTWSPNDQYNSTTMLIEQKYPGDEDYEKHFLHLLKAFRDKRYIRVEDKPIFLIYSPLTFPDVRKFIGIWQNLAKESGLGGVHFIGQASKDSECNKILDLGFDAVCRVGIKDAHDKIKGKYFNRILAKFRHHFKFTALNKYNYADIIAHLINPHLDEKENIYPTIVPNFDHSPRSGRKGLIYTNSSPQLFHRLLKKAVSHVVHKHPENRIILLRSWNEWAEGNYVEPDLHFGKGYIDALKAELNHYQ